LPPPLRMLLVVIVPRLVLGIWEWRGKEPLERLIVARGRLQFIRVDWASAVVGVTASASPTVGADFCCAYHTCIECELTVRIRASPVRHIVKTGGTAFLEPCKEVTVLRATLQTAARGQGDVVV
jgi:hypothetical protein